MFRVVETCVVRQLWISSPISYAAPYLDERGVLREVGRLGQAKQNFSPVKIHPIIVPKKSHLANLLVRHYHIQVNHQGCRRGGWEMLAIGTNKTPYCLYHSCLCHMQKLARDYVHQRCLTFLLIASHKNHHPHLLAWTHLNNEMWFLEKLVVVWLKVRDGLFSSPAWFHKPFILKWSKRQRLHHSIMLSDVSWLSNDECDNTETLTLLEQFITWSGKFVEDESVQQFLKDNASKWFFNPPHASHFGGSWKRMGSVFRQILDAMLLISNQKDHTHETLTLLAQVTANLNSRPLSHVSDYNSDPTVLTPPMKLTHKSCELPGWMPSLSQKDIINPSGTMCSYWQTNFEKKGKRNSFLQFSLIENGQLILPTSKKEILYFCMTAVPHISSCDKDTTPPSDECVREVEIRMYKNRKFSGLAGWVHELVKLLD